MNTSSSPPPFSCVKSLQRRDHDNWDATSYIAGNVSALSTLVIQTVHLRKALLKKIHL